MTDSCDTTTTPKYAYGICFLGSDMEDRSATELLLAIAADADSALLVAQRIAEEQVQNDYYDDPSQQLKIHGVDEARRSLARYPYRSATIKVRDDGGRSYHSCWLVIVPRPLETLQLPDSPVDDGNPLTQTHLAVHLPEEPDDKALVVWSARSASSLMLAPQDDGADISDKHIEIALIQLAEICGEAWTGSVYVFDGSDSVWIMEGSDRRLPHPTDAFAARAVRAHRDRSSYGEGINPNSYQIADTTALVAHNEQFVLLADAPENAGASVTMGTDEIVDAVIEKLPGIARTIFVASRMGTFVYDRATDTFQPGDMAAHPFAQAAAQVL